MNNTNQADTFQGNSPCVVDVTVVKRGRRLQLVASLHVFGVIHNLEESRILIAGKKTPDEALEAFMDALTAGAEPQSATAEGELVSNCFAAMEDNLDIDPSVEFYEAIENGSQALLAQARELIAEAGLAAGCHSELETVEFVIGQTTVVEPPENMGICSVCLREFNLHYIAGSTDLCMSHINPGFI